MAKNSKYAVHEDFRHYPSFTFPFNGVVVALLNAFLHCDTFFRQRHVKAKAVQHKVSSDDGSRFTVYEFQPDKAVDGKRPAIVYFHGGAFVLTYASTHVEAMQVYANELGCSVFMVDYRLAPKYRFPKGFEDCYAATCWVADNAERLGIDKEKLVVMGDSAGGCFSAGVAQKALDTGRVSLAAQVLVYPALDRSCSTRTATEYTDAPMFNGVANKKMWEVYLWNYPPANVPPYAAPADREKLEGLPLAYVETAEFDPLCDEGRIYAERLKAAGVSVELHEPKGTVHGYDTVPDSAITQDTYQRRFAFLRSIFSPEGE